MALLDMVKLRMSELVQLSDVDLTYVVERNVRLFGEINTVMRRADGTSPGQQGAISMPGATGQGGGQVVMPGAIMASPTPTPMAMPPTKYYEVPFPGQGGGQVAIPGPIMATPTPLTASQDVRCIPDPFPSVPTPGAGSTLLRFLKSSLKNLQIDHFLFDVSDDQDVLKVLLPKLMKKIDKNSTYQVPNCNCYQHGFVQVIEVESNSYFPDNFQANVDKKLHSLCPHPYPQITVPEILITSRCLKSIQPYLSVIGRGYILQGIYIPDKFACIKESSMTWKDIESSNSYNLSTLLTNNQDKDGLFIFRREPY
eukprot:TRINITY_DN5932_c0_g1_i1.p1 TRINITY_DN5932_c0_g1~~TRINITY_DN5932_c0_g1_i1.p1  ORF type:complete len:311 (-),score=45.84 TRINITY_DN5932_c0_g1_i1:568-1500(-)